MRSYYIGYVASLTVTLSLFFVPRPLLSISTFPHTLHHTICTPLLRLQRARELHSIHNAVCRARQSGLCCSTCGDLADRVKRLEASRG